MSGTYNTRASDIAKLTTAARKLAANFMFPREAAEAVTACARLIEAQGRAIDALQQAAAPAAAPPMVQRKPCEGCTEPGSPKCWARCGAQGVQVKGGA